MRGADSRAKAASEATLPGARSAGSCAQLSIQNAPEHHHWVDKQTGSKCHHRLEVSRDHHHACPQRKEHEMRQHPLRTIDLHEAKCAHQDVHRACGAVGVDHVGPRFELYKGHHFLEHRISRGQTSVLKAEAEYPVQEGYSHHIPDMMPHALLDDAKTERLLALDTLAHAVEIG